MMPLTHSSARRRAGAGPGAARHSLWVLGLVLGTGCAGSITDPGTEFALAHAAADRWVSAHPNGWTLNFASPRSLSRPAWSRPCAEHPESGFVVLRYASGSTEIDLHFRCPLDGSTAVHDLREAFSHAVLEHLPHGIRSRGWRFRVLTPTSSITETVTFEPAAKGRMQVSVETPLYAVHGHSVRPACQPPADAPSPEGCYLLREHRIPVRLRLVVPFTAAELR